MFRRRASVLGARQAKKEARYRELREILRLYFQGVTVCREDTRIGRQRSGADSKLVFVWGGKDEGMMKERLW